MITTLFDLAPEDFRVRGVSWRRRPQLVGAYYDLLLDGELTEFQVRHCSHPTALRPYYVLFPDGNISERKYSHLKVAQAAAILELERAKGQ